MLVLGRKTNESVLIGEGEDAILVTVITIDRGKVRLGFKAAEHIPIMRTELLKKPTEDA